MRRWVVMLGLIGSITACSNGGSEPVVGARHELFAGEWRSVTPTLEFLRLTLQSKSSERDVLAARLTFSGVYWEGSGRIDGDSLVLHMTRVGPSAEGTLVARIDESGTLRTVLESRGGPGLSVDFVREN